jgi:hypothetical protein
MALEVYPTTHFPKMACLKVSPISMPLFPLVYHPTDIRCTHSFSQQPMLIAAIYMVWFSLGPFSNVVFWEAAKMIFNPTL